MTTIRIALESRLKACRNVITLGVRPNFSDYALWEMDLIRQATTIYYPSVFYADLLDAAGKKTFPSYHTYKCVQDKIKQSALFALLEIPHPRTRTFRGRSRREKILKAFAYPFVAKVPRGSALGRGVYLIREERDLAVYLSQNPIAYIQEYLPIERDLRVVVIGGRTVLAYRRQALPGEFRNNLALGATINFEDVPPQAVALALETAHRCRWDDVGLDVIESGGDYYVLEANMKYGRAGFRQAGIDYIRLMENLMENFLI
jgi:ribosomal protein S6--L-glutamate ligase